MHTPKSLRTTFAKRRWSTADARIVRDALTLSGSSPEAFAAQHGLHPVRVKRLQAAHAVAQQHPPVHFAEVTLETRDPTEDAALRLDVTSMAIELRVLDPARCPPEWVARLALALRGTPS